MRINLNQFIRGYDDRIVFNQEQVKEYVRKGKVESDKLSFNDPGNQEFLRSMREYDLI